MKMGEGRHSYILRSFTGAFKCDAATVLVKPGRLRVVQC
jgi:hypothetical protein